MIRVFIVAPMPMAQAGLSTMLDSESIRVVGTASSLDTIDEQLIDIDAFVIADVAQLEAIGRNDMNTGNSALIILGEYDERVLAIIRQVAQHGWAFLAPDAPAGQLQAAVSAAAQGLIVFPLSAQNWLQQKTSLATVIAQRPGPEEPLTPREQEVLELVSQGLSNKLIARRLVISEHTVKFHLSSLSAKLGASTRTEAVRKGLNHGLIAV
jgi:NarL family two-component system response regulator YdfI